MRWVLIILLFLNTALYAQEEDSVILEFDEFYALVLANHPMAKQADLLTQQAAQQVRLARGSFDPKLEASWQLKQFKDTEYYDISSAAVKIPTWFGLTAEGGIERREGDFLNPENFISDATDNQQVFMGASWNVGNGLFIDQRRAALRQAQIFEQSGQVERIKMLNKLLLTAAKDYWNWYFAYNNYILFGQSITIAEDIFARTKVGFNYGEIAAIDTVQAKANLLTRQTEFLESKIELRRASLTLSNHLWNEDGAPLELIEEAVPEEIVTDEMSDELLSELVLQARNNHPEIRKIQLKGEALLVENRLAREQIRPELNLKYHLLDQPIAPNGGESNNVDFSENYRFGVDFSIPIFLRKERAKLKITDIKLTDNSLSLDFKQRQIINTINVAFTELVNTRLMVGQQAEMAESFRRIVEAERFNLQNGESDLFKLNIQLNKYLEVQSKLIKMKARYKKNIAELYWAAGIENLGYE